MILQLTQENIGLLETDKYGCVGRDSMDFIVKQKPREDFNGFINDFELASSIACNDETLTLKVSHGNNTYKWSSNGTISDTVGSQITTMVTSNQTITVVIDSANGCSTTRNRNYIPGSQKPNLNFKWISDSIICSGDTAEVEAFETSGTRCNILSMVACCFGS